MHVSPISPMHWPSMQKKTPRREYRRSKDQSAPEVTTFPARISFVV